MSAPQGSYACRTDLLDHNRDLQSDIDAEPEPNTIIMSKIHNNNHSVEALNRIFDTYNDTITT